VDALQAARGTSKSAGNDDGNVGSAFALNTITRRGPARIRRATKNAADEL
jgi:hypothetical protein